MLRAISIDFRRRKKKTCTVELPFSKSKSIRYCTYGNAEAEMQSYELNKPMESQKIFKLIRHEDFIRKKKTSKQRRTNADVLNLMQKEYIAIHVYFCIGNGHSCKILMFLQIYFYLSNEESLILLSKF